MHDHSTYLFDAGRKAESEQMDRELIALETRVFGPDHLHTALTIRGLSIFLREQGRTQEADDLLKRAAAIWPKALGLEHERTVRSLDEFGMIFVDGGRAQEAADFALELLPDARRRFSADSSGIGVLLSVLGAAQLGLGRAPEAEATLRECLAIREKQMSDDWRRFYTASLLGEALLAQKKYTEAATHLVAGYDGMRQRAAKVSRLVYRSQFNHALSRLIRVYEETGDAARATEWRQKHTEFNHPPPTAKK